MVFYSLEFDQNSNNLLIESNGENDYLIVYMSRRGGNWVIRRNVFVSGDNRDNSSDSEHGAT